MKTKMTFFNAVDEGATIGVTYGCLAATSLMVLSAIILATGLTSNEETQNSADNFNIILMTLGAIGVLPIAGFLAGGVIGGITYPMTV